MEETTIKMQKLINKVPHRHFFNWDSLFLDDSNTYQVDKCVYVCIQIYVKVAGRFSLHFYWNYSSHLNFAGSIFTLTSYWAARMLWPNYLHITCIASLLDIVEAWPLGHWLGDFMFLGIKGPYVTPENALSLCWLPARLVSFVCLFVCLFVHCRVLYVPPVCPPCPTSASVSGSVSAYLLQRFYTCWSCSLFVFLVCFVYNCQVLLGHILIARRHKPVVVLLGFWLFLFVCRCCCCRCLVFGGFFWFWKRVSLHCPKWLQTA